MSKLGWMQPVSLGTKHRVISTRDLRQNLAEVLSFTAATKDPVVLTRNGAEQAAIVSVEELMLLDFLKQKVGIRELLQEVARNRDNLGREWDRIKETFQLESDEGSSDTRSVKSNDTASRETNHGRQRKEET